MAKTKCNILGCPSVNKHRMPSCADAVHSSCGHGRGRNAFLPGEVTIHAGRHHTKLLQKDPKEHHMDTHQGASCQEQTPRGSVSKSCSIDIVYRLVDTTTHVNRASPRLEPFLKFRSGKQCLQFKELDLVVHIHMSHFLR